MKDIIMASLLFTLMAGMTKPVEKHLNGFSTGKCLVSLLSLSSMCRQFFKVKSAYLLDGEEQEAFFVLPDLLRSVAMVIARREQWLDRAFSN